MHIFVLPFSDPQATLEMVGGKGQSLAKLARAGLPVPDGFHLTTLAYKRFVEANGLLPKILQALENLDAADPARLEQAVLRIRQEFSAARIPDEITAETSAAYAAFALRRGGQAEIAVAVRSSATAEDLPEASFAGQQETYLNIRGVQAVLEAIKQCWASLWTARAIAYRSRQGIAPNAVALAVVIQELVSADAAGVMFTANPLDGKRGECVITAAWGLGESIVGGLVTPDTLTVDKATGKLLTSKISEKRLMTVRSAAGTQEQAVPRALQKKAVLTRQQAARLASLGVKIEQLYEMPVDIEWVLAGGKFSVVQARPITSLPEAPRQWLRANPKSLCARSSFAEFLPDPLSPLFATLAVPIALQKSRQLMKDVMDFKNLEEYTFEVIHGYLYLGFVMSWDIVWKAIKASALNAKAMLQNQMQRWADVRARSRAAAEPWRRDLTEVNAAGLLAGARGMFTATAEYYTVAQSGPIPVAQVSEIIFGTFYRMLVKRRADPPAVAFLLGSDSLPLRAEKSLYDLASWVTAEACLGQYFASTPTALICTDLRAPQPPEPLAGPFAQRYTAHLAEFGHAIYDLDFAKATPADDPTPIVEAIKARLDNRLANPHERQAAQVAQRDLATQAVLHRLDPLRRKWFARLLKWARESGPERENCIADLGLGYPELRRVLVELGVRFATAGAIDRPEDVFWLEEPEVSVLAAALDASAPLTAHQRQVAARKARWQRQREASPPVTLPEKSFLRSLLVHESAGNQLKGYPASAGQVTAPACVLRGPEDFGRMRPGDVIVAVTTTPAWTPLFGIASAVVTDIGGPLSHSSIVAREYGIPAVMATGSATRRIQHGQIITVDGSAGIVTLHEA